jgi:hypothetical protein
LATSGTIRFERPPWFPPWTDPRPWRHGRPEAFEIPAHRLGGHQLSGKVEAALKALATDDLVVVHIEAPDEAAHSGDLQTKRKAIEFFDQKVVGPIWEGLKKMGDFRIRPCVIIYASIAQNPQP